MEVLCYRNIVLSDELLECSTGTLCTILLLDWYLMHVWVKEFLVLFFSGINEFEMVGYTQSDEEWQKCYLHFGCMFSRGQVKVLFRYSYNESLRRILLLLVGLGENHNSIFCCKEVLPQFL